MKKKTNLNLMKTYLARFTIYDGDHEHTAYVLIKETTTKKAIKLAESQEHEAEFCRDVKRIGWFDYGDGTTASKFDGLVELTEEQIKVINDLGLVHCMN